MNGYLSRESKSAWYELSLRSPTRFRISVHRKAFDEVIRQIGTGARNVALFQRIFKFSSFTIPGEKDWGFEDVFQIVRSDRPEWLVWEYPLPNLRGKQDCMAFRATLNVFATSLWLYHEHDSGWKEPQLMVIEDLCLPVNAESFTNNGSLAVTLAPEVIQWISGWVSSNGHERHIPEVVEAMKIASEHLWKGSSEHGRFGAMCRNPKWLQLNVPGDACYLDPGDVYDESLERGYTLQPHNVDNALQQLTFLAGLARLHDLIRAGNRNAVVSEIHSVEDAQNIQHA